MFYTLPIAIIMTRAIFFLTAFLSMTLPGSSQMLKGGGEANPQLLTNKKSLERWQKLRFGLFVHWGPVSLRGTEIGWSRGREVSFEDYDHLYLEFDPVLFDASSWVKMMKDAGMKYLVFVTKHHDGFVLWDSETTDYDIMSTPYGRDVLLELSKECEKQGILFGTYYSIADWRDPDYPYEQNKGEKRGSDMRKYIQYMKAQLRELVTKYHTKILWFDGEWEQPWTHEMGMDLYKYVRGLDSAIIINNRVDKGREGMEGVSKSDRYAGDFATPEQQVGRYDTMTPWESCITMCTQWAWKPNDKLKSRRECIRTLVRTAGGDGNLLFNVGPMLDGRVEKRQIDRLKEIGDWLETNGETIYGTRGGPVKPQDWGVSTHVGNRIFLHVLEPVNGELVIEGLPAKIVYVKKYDSGTPLEFKKTKTGLKITLPENLPVDIDFIVEVGVKSK